MRQVRARPRPLSIGEKHRNAEGARGTAQVFAHARLLARTSSPHFSLSRGNVSCIRLPPPGEVQVGQPSPRQAAAPAIDPKNPHRLRGTRRSSPYARQVLVLPAHSAVRLRPARKVPRNIHASASTIPRRTASTLFDPFSVISFRNLQSPR